MKFKEFLETRIYTDKQKSGIYYDVIWRDYDSEDELVEILCDEKEITWIGKYITEKDFTSFTEEFIKITEEDWKQIQEKFENWELRIEN